MNYVRMAKVLVGGLLGGAAGYGAYYIWQKKPWKKEKGVVVYTPESVEKAVNKIEASHAETVAAEAAEEIVTAVEEMQEVKQVSTEYIPSDINGWRPVGEISDVPGTNYTYYAEDEILVDAEMDEIDDDLFQAVLQTHSMDPSVKQLYFLDVDTMEYARVSVTNEDYANAYNRFVDAKFEAGDVLYPEEE